MRADNERDPPVAEMPHRHLFGCRFGMHVDEDRIGARAERTGFDLALDGIERTVERIHEDTAKRVHDEKPRARRRLGQHRAAAGRAGGIVHRTDEARLALDMDERLAPVPGMIAKRDDVRTGLEKIVADSSGDTETASRVLAVDDGEIELEFTA